MTTDVVIIGGGISGLATGHDLMCRGWRVVVLERQVRAGGNAQSERIGGFLMEHGPSSVNAMLPAAANLSAALGLDAERCELSSDVRYRYLVKNARLHRISTHPFGFFTSDYLPISARLRALAEVLVPPRLEVVEESVAAFWRRRFGSRFAERVIDPLAGGLFAAKADDLSMRVVFPKLVEMERRFGSITKGVMASRVTGGRMPGRRLYSWREGIGTLPRALAAKLGPAVRTGVTVRRIKRLGPGFRIETQGAGSIDTRTVVIATQPHVAATFLENVDDAGAEAAAAIHAPPLAVVFLGYRRQQVDHPLDGLGYLTPSAEARNLTGALFCSTMFPVRAPEGHIALAGYLGGARDPEIARRTPADLVSLVREDFGELVGARGEPVIARVHQWPRGLPQYRLGHGRVAEVLQSIGTRQPGIFVTGNYLTGVSLGNCIGQAVETSAQVQRFLNSNTFIEPDYEMVEPLAVRVS